MSTKSRTDLISYDENGLRVKTFDQTKEYFKNKIKSIFGDDINIEDETPDGQLINLIAEATFDAMNGTASVYQSLSRESAVGVQLDNFASLNNISRRKATNSSAKVKLTGIDGTKIRNGVVRDVKGINWILDPLVVIEKNKEYIVVCSQSGDVYAAPNEINSIVTEVAGWTGVTNESSSVLGKPVENDAQLRYRIRASYDTAAKTVRSGLESALQELDNVTGAIVYENDTDKAMPIKKGSLTQLQAHSIGCVVNGGEENKIAQTILQRKTPGIPTEGTTSVEIETQTVPIKISYFKTESIPVYAKVTIIPNNETYTETIGNVIKEKVSKLLTNLPVASTVLASNVVALLSDPKVSNGDYFVKSVKVGKESTAENVDAIDLDFNQTTNSQPSFITIEVA